MPPPSPVRPARFAVLYALFITSIAVLGEIVIRVYLVFNIVYDVEMTRYANEIKVTAEPNMGHEHRPSSAATLMGVDVSINSDGLRDREYPIDAGGAHRTIFLGDSLTLGWGVARTDTFEFLLEERLNVDGRRPVEILNFGIGNYNTAQEVALFEKKGLKYRPDQVVVFYFINDAEPTPGRSPWGFLGHSRLVTFYWSRINTVLSRYSGRDFRSQYSRLYGEGQPGWQSTKAAFVRLKTLCAANGIRLRVVLLPELHDLKNPPFLREYAMVDRFLTQLDVSVLDLTSHFSKVVDPQTLWVALDDAHPNARAHRMIADFAQQFISPWEQ